MPWPRPSHLACPLANPGRILKSFYSIHFWSGEPGGWPNGGGCALVGEGLPNHEQRRSPFPAMLSDAPAPTSCLPRLERIVPIPNSPGRSASGTTSHMRRTQYPRVYTLSTLGVGAHNRPGGVTDVGRLVPKAQETGPRRRPMYSSTDATVPPRARQALKPA